ncbi:MAG TPA: hypothetical protein VD689_02695 [Nitrosopumilaceae archaeon]|nr:hypothetical protein [Nitrosopumilaceae archaeon]
MQTDCRSMWRWDNSGLSAFNYVERLKGRPGIRADWKKQIGGTVFHY